MNILRLDQAEHAKARQHRLTASRAADLMTGSYKVWNRLAWDMRGEQHLIGQKSGVPALDYGIETEPQVRGWVWEKHPEWDIEPGGLLLYHDQEHPLFGRFCACSPDGIISVVSRLGSTGADISTWGLEVKCPYNPLIHLGYVRSGQLPEAYIPQVQFSLWCSGLDRWLFVTGDPRIDDAESYAEHAIAPDPVYHARITELATKFLEGYESHEEFKPLGSTAAAFDKMFP